ncbi:MAG TPA: NADH-quinone oxidoreductase subunit J [Dehalococcoidales bacterium]|nr:NADH-quinone oxidoreductase subunit J [Dehalococcoidales bacterium]
MLEIAFWIIAIIGVVSALSVIIFKDVFRAALGLVLCFISAAGIYVTLNADYLAVVQILIYVGAIGVLIIIAIMLTKEVQLGNLSNKLIVPAFIVSAAFLAVLVYSILQTAWPVTDIAPPEVTAGTLAERLFGENGFILPMQIAAMLLLAAVLGAITLVKEKKE